MKLIFTIDTEGDNQWDAGLPRSTDNIRFIPRFQDLCDRYRFPPTYLCTYEVVESAAFNEILLPLHKSGRAEIGAHLHPWTTPPLSKWDRSETGAAYPSELPAGLFAQKLESLTALLAAKLGERPDRRAGRWGLSAHIPVLLGCGYIVDCSVTLLSAGATRCPQRARIFAPGRLLLHGLGDPLEGASGLSGRR